MGKILRSFVAAVAALVLLGACVGPITYRPGRSLADVPVPYTPVALASVSQSTMMGEADIADSQYGAVLDRAGAKIVETFKQKGMEVVPAPDRANLVVHAKIYWLPWTAGRDGQIDVSLKVHDRAGTELFTAVFGRNFTLFDLTGRGEMGVVDRAAELATVNVVNELDKKIAKR